MFQNRKAAYRIWSVGPYCSQCKKLIDRFEDCSRDHSNLNSIAHWWCKGSAPFADNWCRNLNKKLDRLKGEKKQ